MPTPPSGKIIARPMVVRACGHEQEFQHYEVDKFRAQRLAKFQSTRCANCVAKLVEQQQTAQKPKGEAVKQLPAGAQFTMTFQDDGTWAGTLTAGGTTVQTSGAIGTGPAAILAALARMWVAAKAGKTPQK
jgi:hypothetical protein